jgi:hypothetical protein
MHVVGMQGKCMTRQARWPGLSYFLSTAWGQISDIQVTGQSEDMTAKEKLLLWSQRMVEGYQGLRCDNFTTSWRDGRLFNAIIHRHKYVCGLRQGGDHWSGAPQPPQPGDFKQVRAERMAGGVSATDRNLAPTELRASQPLGGAGSRTHLLVLSETSGGLWGSGLLVLPVWILQKGPDGQVLVAHTRNLATWEADRILRSA